MLVVVDALSFLNINKGGKKKLVFWHMNKLI